MQFRVKLVAARVRTPPYLVLSHEHFLLAMCLHWSLKCCVCYVLNEHFRFCVKSMQFREKLVAARVRTPPYLVLSHEHFLLAMSLHESLKCCVCYVLNEHFRFCVKSMQSRVKLVAARVRTPSTLVLSHEHFLFAMCLHGSLMCCVCHVLIEHFRYYVKSIQFRVKLVGGYITILVINRKNLIACQIVLL